MKPVASSYSGSAGSRYFACHGQADGAGYGAFLAGKFKAYVKPTHRVLDFGCGAGWLLAALEAREKVGVEVNPDAIALARGLGLDVRQSLSEVEAGRFDAWAISNHALEHTLNPYFELRGLHRALVPGGLLVLHLPINDWRAEKDPHAPDPNHHLYTWTPLLITNLLEEAGFSTTEASIVNNGGVGRFTVQLSSKMPRRMFDALSAATAVLRRRRELHVVAVRREA